MTSQPDQAPQAEVDRQLAAPVDSAPQVKKTERPHPLTPFIRGWIIFVAILIGWSRELIPDGDGNGFDSSNLRWMLPVLAAVLVVAAIAGFVTWRFTRFVIDDEEVRIETGALFKNSKRISFERLQSVDIVQPFAARLFGLAELRLEVGSGDSSIRLRYLSRAKAGRLRDYLMARAHGEQATIAETAGLPEASIFTDLSIADRPLVTVSPVMLVGGFLLSSDWLITLLIVIAAFVVSGFYDVVAYALPGLIPLGIAGLSMIGRRVIAQFNFTLAESVRGLRITRGLTNLTSQSVPIDRIQGLRISQSLLWRPLGWYRVDVDVLGFAKSGTDENQGDATSILLPVATLDQVKLALDRVLPDVDLENITLHHCPRRARWVRFYDWWTLRYGWDDSVIVTQNGWLIQTRNIVPHAKTQSVRIEQGPLQRALKLADVHVDTPKGPVNLIARQLDPAAARELAMSQLDRARIARRAATVPHPSDPARAGEMRVLDHFGLKGVPPLGQGGEAVVYPLGPDHVLRLYRPGASASRLADQLRRLYGSWSKINIGIQLPQIVEAGELAGRSYTVDRRILGADFSAWLATAEPELRRQALLSYLDAAQALRQLPLPPGFAPGGPEQTIFGRLLGDAPQRFSSLADLLNDQLDRTLQVSGEQLRRDVAGFELILDQLRTAIAGRHCEPRLVHGDLCPPNAFVTADPYGAPVITGVGDFSPHTLAADPILDIAAAVWFLGLERYDGADADTAWLASVAAERLGPEDSRWLEIYRRYYAIYYSMTVNDPDPWVYSWCLAQLRSTAPQFAD